MEPVGVGLRAVATIIDTVLLLVVGYVLALFTGNTTATGFNLSGGPFFIWLLIAIGYYTVLEARSGQTLGKRLINLKVVKLEGAAPIDMQAAIVRNVLRLVDGFLFYLIGAIAVWTSDKKQRLGDRVAGTIVVRSRPT
ncbi:MAG: RDD family protein [Burkholderiales bacterium]